MPVGTPKNRRGRQIGAKNKATLSTFAPTETLMEWQESRLQAYIDTMREVRVGPGHTRGSVNDFIRLAARSTRHKSVRGHLVNTIRDDEVMQVALGSAEEVYHARLSAEVEKLAGVDIFGQYTPDAMDKTQELQDDALAEQVEEYVACMSTFDSGLKSSWKLLTIRSEYPRSRSHRPMSSFNIIASAIQLTKKIIFRTSPPQDGASSSAFHRIRLKAAFGLSVGSMYR